MKTGKFFQALFIVIMVGCQAPVIHAEVNFSTAVQYGTGVGPLAHDTGDLNGDGYPDIVTANATGSVSVLIGYGNGSFRPAVDYTAGSGTYAVSIGDLDGDGVNDVAAANADSAFVSVFLGNGDGTLQPADNNASTDIGSRWIEIGDLNGDGDNDIVIANRVNNYVSVLLGNGDGTFQSQVAYPVGDQAYQVDIGDLNGDGIPDLATANYAGNNVSVLLGNGNGTFQAAVSYPAGLATRAIDTGDLNGDGYPDIVTSNWNMDINYVTVHLNNGNGTFGSPVNYSAGYYTRSVAIDDFDMDGTPDIAVTNYSDDMVSILVGNGNGTFQTSVNYSVSSNTSQDGPHCIAIADFNRDGKTDISIANDMANNVSVLLNYSPTGPVGGETLITTTQEYYTAPLGQTGVPGPASFIFQTGNNFFEEPDGTLHAAYVENYELYYCRSTDGGQTWSKENIATSHNGDLHCAALTVDHDGNVFIGFTVHDLYNYANPAANAFYTEWEFDLYCIHNKYGEWAEETIYAPTRGLNGVDNYGPKAMAIVVDADNNVHLFANRYGWYTYGGTAWGWVRDSASDNWGAQITAATITTASVDHFFYDYYRPLVDSTGTITLIMSRANSTSGDDDYLFYVQNDGTWSGITAIDQPNRDYASAYHFDAAIDGSDHIYLVYVKDITPGVPQIFLSTDFGTAVPVHTGVSGEQIYDLKLHSDSAGNLTLIVRRGISGSSVYPTSVMKRPAGGSWASFQSIKTAAPDSDVFYLSVARTDTTSGIFNNAKLTYFDRTVTGQTSPGPYGPDSFYFNALQAAPPGTNNRPSAPIAVSPADEAAFASGPVTLEASDFSDPDAGDSHIGTYWMVRRADSVYGREDYDESFNYMDASGDLTAHTISGLLPGMKYVWRVGYMDSGSETFTWSNECSFRVGQGVSEAMPEIEEGTEMADYKMMSFPYWLDDPSAMAVFDIDYDTRYYRIGHYEASRNLGEYVEISDPLAELNPGEAVWVLAREGISVTADGIPVTSGYDIEVPLLYNSANGNGWNQIGCPSVVDFYWCDLQVIEYDTNGNIIFGPVSISELESTNEYLDIRIWEWGDGDYVSYTPDDDFIMKAHEGYWVKAKKANVRLNFPVIAQYAANRFNGNRFAALFERGKKWARSLIISTPLAVADSGDSPPMPMGAFTDSNESRASQGGCFIATAAYGSPYTGLLSGLFVMLLGVIGLVMFHQPKNGLFRNRQRS